jgi:hypothetical protein
VECVICKISVVHISVFRYNYKSGDAVNIKLYFSGVRLVLCVFGLQ